MAMSDKERAYYKVVGLLGQERNIERVKKMMMSNGIAAGEADQLVDSVYNDIKSHNRKKAIWKIVISAILLLIFGVIMISTGILFYIILPFSAIGLLWGVVKLMTASGYELDSSDEGED
jgi:uncharacterized protein YoaH (UPF0181 family)